MNTTLPDPPAFVANIFSVDISTIILFFSVVLSKYLYNKITFMIFWLLYLLYINYKYIFNLGIWRSYSIYEFNFGMLNWTLYIFIGKIVYNWCVENYSHNNIINLENLVLVFHSTSTAARLWLLSVLIDISSLCIGIALSKFYTRNKCHLHK